MKYTMASGAAALLVLGAFLPRASAQLPNIDMVQVSLPYEVIAGDKTLPPGDYTIEQLPTDDDSPVLMISNSAGLKVRTMAMTSRALDLQSPRQSTVSLLHVGKKFYLDQVWVEGNPYGYVIALPQRLRRQAKDLEPVVLPARTGQ
ncbi:MAG TPA: hypothetical protein VMB03_27645 [Bryobacteraceae bacterium]|nr:hypothetical protein [Bryobacteraceae bacterium]